MAVRREKVILELEDQFTTRMARAAAATALMKRELGDLDGTSTKTGAGLRKTSEDTDALGRSTRRTSPEIDRFSGRLSILRDAALTLGPALVPLGGAAVVGVAALTTQLGAAAGAAGVAAIAFNGIGEAVEAVRTYELEPTTENLEEMQRALQGMGEAGADFVMFLSSIRPQLREIQLVAREGLLPGVQEGLESLLTMGPQVQRIVGNIAGAMGELAARSGEALSGDRFAGFFTYIETEAIPLLTDMGRTFGFVIEGLANLMVAFSPLTRDFSTGMVEMAESFARWSRGLEDNTAFQSFAAYLRENGPAAVDALGSIINALAGLVQAAAPVGSAVLPVITALADAFASLASSPIGSPLLGAAAAFVTLNRALSVGQSLYGSTAVALDRLGVSAQTTGRRLDGVGRAAGSFAAVAAIGAGIGSWIGDLTGANLELENLARNLQSIANGVQTDALGQIVDDLRIISDRGIVDGLGEATVEVLSLNGAFGMFDTTLDGAQRDLAAVDQQLAALVESGRGDEAAAIFEAIVASLNGLPAGASLSQQALDETMRHFTAYGTAADNAAVSTDAVAGATRRGAAALGQQTNSLQENIDAMRAKRDATLAAFDAETQWRQALNTAREAANKNSAGIKGNSEAALENRAALSQLAQAWNNQSNAVKNNEDRFRAARRAMIEAAEGMGITREEAVKLTDRLLEVPKETVTKARVETAAAYDRIAALRRDLAAIPDETVNVWVTRRQVDGSPGMGPISRAQGGMVTGPGTGTSDSIPAWLSNGEFVVNAAATSRHRALLEQINAQRFATGGIVQNYHQDMQRTYAIDQSRHEVRQMAAMPQTVQVSTGALEQRLAGLERRMVDVAQAVRAADANNQRAVVAGADQFGRQIRNEVSAGQRRR